MTDDPDAASDPGAVDTGSGGGGGGDDDARCQPPGSDMASLEAERLFRCYVEEEYGSQTEWKLIAYGTNTLTSPSRAATWDFAVELADGSIIAVTVGLQDVSAQEIDIEYLWGPN
ncbi:MAG: hypothetical protein AAGA56_17190, partial [Myxococcota bacterium]